MKSKNSRQRIALDMDEVIADVLPKFLDYYEKDIGHKLSKEEFWGQKIYELVGAGHIRNYLYDPGFFADLPVIENSQEVVKWLNEHYDVFLVSAAMQFRNSLADKRDWAQKHFPFIHWKNIVFCGDKSIIQTDYMIDDHAKNLETFKGKALLYTATHNIHEKRFTRVSNWLEIRTFFEKELNG